MLKQSPNILGQTSEEMIQYVLDWKHYYYLNPTHSQETNIYFEK